MTSLADALPSEIKRVRGLRDQYVSMRGMAGVNVEPVIFMIDHALDGAIVSAANGDVVAMACSLASLRGFTD